MKLILCLVLALSLAVPSMCLAANTQDEVSMPASSIPVLKQIAGKGAATIVPGRYPEFVSFEPITSAPACEAALKAKSYKNIVASGARDFANYAVIPGWAEKEITIPERNRRNSKLMIIWTVRVEADAEQKALEINGALDAKCPTPWYGNSVQKLKGGTVFAQLFIDGKPRGEKGSMTVPDYGVVTFTKVPPPPPPASYDPTISGSFLITPDMYPAKTLPAKISIDVRWFNDTAIKMMSPDRQRSIIVKIVPGT